MGFGVQAKAENEYEISEENNQLVSILATNDSANEDYIASMIEMYHSIPSESDSYEDFNEFLKKSLLELQNYDEIQNDTLEKTENMANLEVLTRKSRALMVTPYELAIAAYNTGISLVNRRGHWQTVNYMRRAVVPQNRVGSNFTPAKYYNKDDNWAKIMDGEELARTYYSRLKAEAFSGGRASGSFSGTHTFKSGHLLTALRGVSYTVTYKRQSNGNYYTSVKVTDIFDFKWEPNGYNNFAVGFGNNYCYAMQQSGYIKPFKIEIVRTMSR